MSFAEDLGVAFAMHCDVNGLSAEQVEALAEEVQGAVEASAESCIELRRAAA